MTAGEPVYVGLGANLGDARATLAAALAALAVLPQTQLCRVSPFYRSAPVQAQGPDFINAVAELRTALAPELLLQQLLACEEAHGRRRPYPNAPRTLDLDLLLYGQRVLDSPLLTLPHPRLHLRAFVLQPLLHLAPELQHPLLGDLRPWALAAAGQPLQLLPEA